MIYNIMGFAVGENGVIQSGIPVCNQQSSRNKDWGKFTKTNIINYIDEDCWALKVWHNKTSDPTYVFNDCAHVEPYYNNKDKEMEIVRYCQDTGNRHKKSALENFDEFIEYSQNGSLHVLQ